MAKKLLCIFLFHLLMAEYGFSQIDPSNATLLQSREETIGNDSFNPNRYVIKENTLSQPDTAHARENSSAMKNSGEIEKEEGKLSSSTKNIKIETTSPPLLNKEVTKENRATPINENNENKKEQKEEKKISDMNSVVEVGSQMRDLLLGGSTENIQEYKSLLHPDDLRQNLVEISAGAGVFYQDSGSNYWYRQHYSYAPLVSAEAALWVTPFLGFTGSFSTSFGAEISGSSSASNRIPVNYQWWSGGLIFRKAFGLDRRSPHFFIGIDFNENRMVVASNESERLRTNLSGFALSLSLQKPSSTIHSWEIGFKFLPRENQTEGKTRSLARSGAKSENSSLVFWLGSKLILDRKDQYFWKISHHLDKSLYDKQATVSDPISGLTPNGVQVTINTTMFILGYTWGE